MFNIEILEVQKSQLEVTKEDANRTQKMIESGIRIKADLLEIEATTFLPKPISPSNVD